MLQEKDLTKYFRHCRELVFRAKLVSPNLIYKVLPNLGFGGFGGFAFIVNFTGRNVSDFEK